MSGGISAGARQKALAKLAQSALTAEDMDTLGMVPYDDGKSLDDGFDACPGLMIPYMELTGEPMITRAGDAPFWRVRQFHASVEEHQAEAIGFDAQTTGKKMEADGKEKKDKRYLQPGGSVTGPYFPSMMIPVRAYDGEELQWPDIALDPSVPIYITEGEFKAACACKHGFATIGLGGVWSFKSKKEGYLMLPHLEQINWRKREVFVVYDTDVAVKEQPIQSINEIAMELYKRGADVWHLRLYEVEGLEKTGLDDFLVHEGPEAFAALVGSSVDRLVNCLPLWKLNDQYVHITNNPTHTVLEISTGELIKEPAKWAQAHAGDKLIRYTLDKELNPIPEEMETVRTWLGWPMHKVFKELEYNPAHTPLAPIDARRFNAWTGWAVQPRKGDTRILQEWFKHVFGDDMADLKFFLQWHAYPLQYPGTKMSTAILMVSQEQGTGKSTFAEAMMGIYGKNYTTVDQNNFFEKFNPWADHRQYVVANEIFAKWQHNETRARMSLIRDYITRKTVKINKKFMEERDKADYSNILFTANYTDVLPIEKEDRRIYIYKSKAGRISEEFMRRWHHWLNHENGYAALFWYLLNEVDTSDFNPYAPAPMNSAKEEAIEMTKSEQVRIVEDLIANGPYGIGQHIKADLLILDQWWAWLTDDQRKALGTPTQLKRHLVEVGKMVMVPRVAQGAEKRLKYKGQLVQVWCLRNQEKWGGYTMGQADLIRKHLTEHDISKDKTEKY